MPKSRGLHQATRDDNHPLIIMSWLKKYWSGLLLASFAIAWLWVRHDRNLMHQRAHYTIGHLSGWHATPKSGIYYNYHFTVAGSAYEGSSPSEAGMRTADGERCVVKYDSVDPTTNVGYFAVFVPDSIRQAPANGWRVLPFPIPQWILDRETKK